jgi:hypothetical protein
MRTRHQQRIYGSIMRMSEEDGRRLVAELDLDDVRFEAGELCFEHLAPWVDVDRVVALITSALGPQTSGQFDHIDDEEWLLTRYSIEGTEVSIRRVPLNDALDKYIYE